MDSPMTESLHERLRAFKPYDRALAAIVVVLVAASGEATLIQRLLIGTGGVLLFCSLDLVQRRLRVPLPFRKSLIVVCLNTFLVSVLVYHLRADHSLAVPLYFLNVAFATVAFGTSAGLAAVGWSAVALWQVDLATGIPARPFLEWGLLVAMLLALVALVSRIASLREDALTDALTGLRNHRYFQLRLREELARTRRYGRPTGLAILDLDNFKRVNDRLGHAAGDAVLRRAARVLEQGCRATDVLCRYGGEELAVILPEATADEASRLTERLRRGIENHFRRDCRLTVSIGFAIAADWEGDAATLVAAADAALYQAKRAGKNQVCSAAAEKQRASAGRMVAGAHGPTAVTTMGTRRD
jgi:diguanylate cyclase (GGDEF)-like protein